MSAASVSSSESDECPSPRGVASPVGRGGRGGKGLSGGLAAVAAPNSVVDEVPPGGVVDVARSEDDIWGGGTPPELASVTSPGGTGGVGFCVAVSEVERRGGAAELSSCERAGTLASFRSMG